MSIPTEIDQGVKCPECGKPLCIYDNGEGSCETHGCDNGCVLHPKTVAALRNQRTPGTVEIDADRWSEVVRAHVERDRRATIQVSLRG